MWDYEKYDDGDLNLDLEDLQCFISVEKARKSEGREEGM